MLINIRNHTSLFLKFNYHFWACLWLLRAPPIVRTQGEHVWPPGGELFKLYATLKTLIILQTVYQFSTHESLAFIGPLTWCFGIVLIQDLLPVSVLVPIFSHHSQHSKCKDQFIISKTNLPCLSTMNPNFQAVGQTFVNQYYQFFSSNIDKLASQFVSFKFIYVQWCVQDFSVR